MKRSIMIVLSLCLLSTPSIKAKEKMVLIYGKELPYLYLLQEHEEQQMDVYVIPSDLYLCNTPLSNLSNSALQSQISEYLGLSYGNYVSISLDYIYEDFQIDKANYDLSTMKGMTDYFEQIKNNMTISDLLNYQKYIESDLRLSDYYDYYQLFSQKLTIHYHYLPILKTKEFSIPLDTFPTH